MQDNPAMAGLFVLCGNQSAFQFRNQAAEKKPIADMLLAREAAVKSEQIGCEKFFAR